MTPTYATLANNVVKYNNNFDNILASVKGSKAHLRLVIRERKLDKKGIRIRESLGIRAIDPCGNKACVRQCVLSSTFQKAENELPEDCFLRGE